MLDFQQHQQSASIFHVNFPIWEGAAEKLVHKNFSVSSKIRFNFGCSACNGKLLPAQEYLAAPTYPFYGWWKSYFQSESSGRGFEGLEYQAEVFVITWQPCVILETICRGAFHLISQFLLFFFSIPFYHHPIPVYHVVSAKWKSHNF